MTGEQQHRASLEAIMQQGQALIADEKIRFVFIHLPVPHPPGIYDRSAGKLRDGGTYIDNLALADRSLGELVSSLNASASAGNTTLIVTSDHSWRTPMWTSNTGLLPEEQAASQRRFDPRPMLMIHLPEQTREVDVGRPFAQLTLHRIIVSMLQGHIESAPTLRPGHRRNGRKNRRPFREVLLLVRPPGNKDQRKFSTSMSSLRNCCSGL